MKIFIFLNEEGKIIEKIEAEDHTMAIFKMEDEEAQRLEMELPQGCEYYTKAIND